MKIKNENNFGQPRAHWPKSSVVCLINRGIFGHECVGPFTKKSARFNGQFNHHYCTLRNKVAQIKCRPLFIVGDAPKLGAKAQQLTEI